MTALTAQTSGSEPWQAELLSNSTLATGPIPGELTPYLRMEGLSVFDFLSQRQNLSLAYTINIGDFPHTVQHLLDLGVDPNEEVRGYYPNTALLMAAQKGRALSIEVLLRNGADASKTTDDNRNPLHLAAQGEHAEALRALIAGSAPNDVRDMMGAVATYKHLTPLHCAAAATSVEAVRILLDHGANKEALDGYGFSPLSVAAGNGRLEIVQLLLNRNADPNQASPTTSTTALHRAALCGHTAVVNSLLRPGTWVNVKDDRGRTPLHLAADNGNVPMIRLLLHYGADWEAEDSEGMTPLLYAKAGKRNFHEQKYDDAINALESHKALFNLLAQFALI